MKLFGRVLTALTLFMGTPAFAAAVPVVCTPYNIPIQSTLTSCGTGMMGSKYKTMTKTCPDGQITESKDFDVSGCVTAPTGNAAAISLATRCRLMPDSCTGSPNAAACPSGQHWSLLGTEVAHCVQDDPVCPWGTSLTHDKLGNPSCLQNTCPSNQVLQADGKACGCQNGTGWNGYSCVPPSCFAGTAITSSSACTYGGTQYYSETTSCPSGPYGAPIKSGAWDQSGCAPRPITCTTSSYTESAACGADRNGTMTRGVYTNCPGGQYGSPSTSYGSWNESSCTPACTPSQSTSATACGSGYSGTMYITTYYYCPSGSSQSTNTSGCGCANGAADYPTCTPPAPPPSTPSATCITLGTKVPVGTQAEACDIPKPKNPHPAGMTYRCTASGWVVATAGNSKVSEYCN